MSIGSVTRGSQSAVAGIVASARTTADGEYSRQTADRGTLDAQDGDVALAVDQGAVQTFIAPNEGTVKLSRELGC
jgi:hypothetical protein